MKKILENKKLIILIIVLLIIAIGVSIWLNKNKTDENSETNEPNTTSEVVETNFDELINNAYLYAYLIMGDIKVSDGYSIIDEQTYYYVDDELLKDFKTISDITEMMTNTFTENILGEYIGNLSSGEYNKFMEMDEVLYVQKKEPICKNFLKYDRTKVIATETDENSMWLAWGYSGMYAYKEEGKWLLNSYYFKCLDEE